MSEQKSDADLIRGKLTTDEAQTAFDKLNALRPCWTAYEGLGNSGEHYVSANFWALYKDDPIPGSVGSSLAATFDEAVLDELEALRDVFHEHEGVTVTRVVCFVGEKSTPILYDQNHDSFTLAV